ncbi:MAG: insulinase family protein [Armatimonadota bacterium]|nr:MAG: insulinase family protein [Armatimonadota bacterium]
MPKRTSTAIADKVQRIVLDNGLRVLIKEIHAAPVVTFWAWYGVGSRNELPGITGVSHWVEHMLFKGTDGFAKGEIMRQVSRLGGYLNGFTSEDHTVYLETLPREHLELAARIESDRMVNARFSPDDVGAERTVILSERSMSENDPGFLLYEEVQAAAFRVHPYRWHVLGWRSDLESITRDDLYHHYRTYYTPGNCILVLAGDFAAAEAAELVHRYFDPIAAAPEPPALRGQEPSQSGERRVSLRKPGAAARVQLAYHVPEIGHPDLPALIACDAILGGAKPVGFGSGVYLGRSSRLYRALVEGGLASSIGCYLAPGIDPGLFHFRMMVRDGVSPQDAECRALEEVERLRAEAPEPAELAKAIRQMRAQYAYGASGVSSQASALGYYESTVGYRYLTAVLDAVAALTPDDVRAAAEKYLRADNRTVGVFEPTAPAPETRAPGKEVAMLYSVIDRPAFATGGDPALPRVQESFLDNGARLLVNESKHSPAIVVRGSLKVGGALETDDTAGLANFTATTLRRGAGGRSRDEIADVVESVGGQIGCWCSSERVSFAAKGLEADLPLLLEILSDCLRAPTFPSDQVELARNEIITGIKDELDDPHAMAEHDLHELAYAPGHPYRRHISGTLETVSRLSAEDLAEFHRRCYGPQTMIVAVVGDKRAREVLELVERSFGDWAVPGVADFEIAPPGDPPNVARRIRTMKHKSQVDIALGYRAISRTDDDFTALNLADNILGRLGLMGRLGKTVRDDQGLAYYAGSSVEACLGRGLWKLRAGVSPAHVERALESVCREINRLRSEPPPADELADAKSNQIGGLALRLETNEGVADAIHDVAYWDLGLDYLARYRSLVEAVTAEHVMEVAARCSDPRESAVAVAGPYED